MSPSFTPFVFVVFLVCEKDGRCSFLHLNCEYLDVSMFRSVVCLLQRWRFLPQRTSCNSEERVVMGDVYRYR